MIFKINEFNSFNIKTNSKFTSYKRKPNFWILSNKDLDIKVECSDDLTYRESLEEYIDVVNELIKYWVKKDLIFNILKEKNIKIIKTEKGKEND